MYFGHETSLSQCLFLPKQRASVVNEEKKHEQIFVFFFYVYKASEGKCWQARGVSFTLLPLRVSFLTRVSTRPEKDRKETTTVLAVEGKKKLILF